MLRLAFPKLDNMKRIAHILPALIVSLALLSSCDKNKCDKSDPGIGGGSKVSGHVQHHGTAIPNARVFIKYDATEFPGTDTTQYDAAKTATNSDAYYTFMDLKPGDYYLYSVGYDNNISLPVSGGVGIEICGDEEDLNTNIPVTE